MSSQIKSSLDKLRKFSEVSIISLDALKPSKNLSPGEPYGLAPGVTISVLQSASEGLLEIAAQAAATTQVDEKPSSELATVHIGQVIKTIEGPFVMVRHLDSFIIPRKSGEARSPEIMQALSLALADAAAKESSFHEHPPDNCFTYSLYANSLRALSSKPGQIRFAIGALTLLMLCWYFFSFHKERTSILPVQAKLSETAKSKILAPLDLRESALPAPGTPPELKNGEEVVEIDEGPVLRTAKISVSETAHPAPKKTAVLDEISKIAMPKTSMASVSPLVRNTKLKNEILPGKNLAQLTVKERLAVTEFKLEARYDRSSARAKLKHMADSFPIGSPAQFEILKAYNGL